MTNPTIQQNLKPVNEPSMADLLKLFRKNLMLDFACHHIGVIQSFNPTKQTVSVSIAYKKTFFQLNAVTGAYDAVLRDYPLLIDCPAIVLGGGNANLTFPINKGDECLILFNDRDIDNWFQSGQLGPVSTPRLHSLSDGFALVGINSLANSISGYDTTRAVLRNGNTGTTIVGVGESLVKIANATTTLNTLLQSLVTNIENLVTQTSLISVTGVSSGLGTSGPPANAAAILAIGTQLTTLATQISGLLE